MEYCEFLLQKEGDRAWLPLESPSVEVLEGRYRLIARSSYPDTAVEIRVGYQPDREIGLATQRSQSRSAQTNANGLVVAIPFTALRPGLWEFSCQQGAAAADDGQPWRYAVTLQVLAVEAEDWVDVEPSPMGDAAIAPASPPTATPTPEPITGDNLAADVPEASSIPAASSSNVPEISDLPSLEPEPIALDRPPIPEPEPIAATMPVSEALTDRAPAGDGAIAELDAPTDEALEPITDQATTDDPTTDEATIPLPALPPTEPFTPPIERLIQVEDDRLLRIADQLLQQMVDPLPEEEAADPAAAAAHLPPLQLRLDRTTYITAWGDSLVLQGSLEPVDSAQGSSVQTLPSTLEWRVTLRDPNSQRVLVRLRQPIAGSQWTRPADRALPGQFVCRVELPIEASTFLMLGELALYPNALASAEPLAGQAFAVAADADALLKAIEPDFRPEDCTEGDRAIAPAAPGEALPFRPNPHPAQKKGLDLKLLNLVQPAGGRPPEPPVAAPVALPAAEADRAALAEDEGQVLRGLPATAPRPEPTVPPLAIEPPSREPSLFDALPSGQRFWSRLTALADDHDLRAWMRARGDGVAPAPEPPDPDADWTAGEVLVDDVFPVLGQTIPRSEPPPTDVVLPANVLVPPPAIELLTHPLVAETTATLRLRVRDVPSRLCLKVWTSDRQTRQILEPPRWLLELPPNGLGELEARVTIAVPPQVAELSIEAVTMELGTHRESRKTVMVVPVMPPDSRDDRPALDPLAINTLFEALSPSRWD